MQNSIIKITICTGDYYKIHLSDGKVVKTGNPILFNKVLKYKNRIDSIKKYHLKNGISVDDKVGIDDTLGYRVFSITTYFIDDDNILTNTYCLIDDLGNTTAASFENIKTVHGLRTESINEILL